ncbi:MAG: DNA-3-methyladenine glycosylase 2 family protein [Erysipelotrichaceae bacterium]|nr:DNA-3-methyladenine glycosylase 2 family protein [Erysipelotrichaceae bacterium]
MYFPYGDKEITYLKSKDKKLGEAIDKIGIVQRPILPDIFTGIVYNIIGQQISTAVLNTVWHRLNEKLNIINVDSILSLSREELKSISITYKKADYILGIAQKIKNNEYSLAALYDMSDEEAIKSLSSLKGIGRWSGEMILIFSMQRKDVLSYDDLAIQRGMRMLYHHKKIDKKKFNRYKKRYSPYGTIASIYLWAIAGGAIKEMRDYQ